MKILILLILFCITSAFSQKLWEIQVNPDDLLRDVKEIPNSDLLLFTYNTGKLEIRRSEDGSLVRDVIRPQGEVGSYSISGLGNSYYFSERAEYMKGKEDTYINDTIFIYDLFSDEIINKISFDIGDYKDRNNFMSKSLTYNFTPDMTKVFGKVGYFFNNGPGDQYFYVYDINQKKIIYTEEVNKLINDNGQFTNPGFYLDSYRSSPDSKYIILNGRDNGNGYNDKVRGESKIFDIEKLKFIKVFYSDNENYYYEYQTLLNGKIENSFVSFLDPIVFIRFTFPDFVLINNLNIFNKYNVYLTGNNNQFNLCEDILTCMVAERKEQGTQKFFKYFIKYNFSEDNIVFNSKNFQINLDFCNIFTLNDCNKLIVDKDFDNRDGIIACYNYNTLDIETLNISSSYFSKTGLSINFNSQEFIGQLAKIEIFNSTGNKVGMLNNGIINQANYSFNLPELASGAYYIQCQLPNQNLSFKFVVVR